VLADGTYRLKAPLLFGSADSGVSGAPVVWTAAPGAHPVLSGATRVQGWAATHTPGVWAAPVPQAVSLVSCTSTGARRRSPKPPRQACTSPAIGTAQAPATTSATTRRHRLFLPALRRPAAAGRVRLPGWQRRLDRLEVPRRQPGRDDADHGQPAGPRSPHGRASGCSGGLPSMDRLRCPAASRTRPPCCIRSVVPGRGRAHPLLRRGEPVRVRRRAAAAGDLAAGDRNAGRSAPRPHLQRADLLLRHLERPLRDAGSPTCRATCT